MKHLTILLLIAITVFLNSCTDTPSGPDNKTVTIDKDITANITFKTGYTYIIDGNIKVKNATIIIEPGVVVKFTPDSELVFALLSSESASIKALGTAEKPIVFTSSLGTPLAGDWDDMYFYKGARDCEFAYCKFEYGGGDPGLQGMIVIKETAVKFTNCIFRKAKNSAIEAKVSGFFSEFTNNTLTENGIYPIVISPNYVHTIGSGNTINTGSGILISNDSHLNIPGNYTWLNHKCAYIIESDLRIGAPGDGVSLTIEPGSVLKFARDAELLIAYGNTDIATLIARGTATDKIVFTAFSSNPQKNDWKGIEFRHGSRNCSLDYCEVMYGGYSGVSSGLIYINQTGSQVTISNSLIAHTISNAISIDKTTTLDITNGLTFEDIDLENLYIR